MAEEETKSESEAKNDYQDYIKAIQDLKDTTVPKEQYAKLKAENKQLLDTLVAGGQLEPQQAEKRKTSEEWAKELVGHHTNLEYAEIALKQREAALEEGKPDPFIPSGRNFTQSRATDAQDAQAAADLLQSCVDDADGDPNVFLGLFQSRVKDLPGATLKRKR